MFDTDLDSKWINHVNFVDNEDEEWANPLSRYTRDLRQVSDKIGGRRNGVSQNWFKKDVYTIPVDQKQYFTHYAAHGTAKKIKKQAIKEIVEKRDEHKKEGGDVTPIAIERDLQVYVKTQHKRMPMKMTYK